MVPSEIQYVYRRRRGRNKIDYSKILGIVHKHSNYDDWNSSDSYDGQYFNYHTIIRSSVAKGTQRQYLARFNKFHAWFMWKRSRHPDLPSYSQMQQMTNPLPIQKILLKYMIFNFNVTHNLGKTVMAEISAISFYLAEMDIFVSVRNNPQFARIREGIDRICQNQLKRKVKYKKFAILLPIFLAILAIISNKLDRFAIGFGFSYALRSENYVKPKTIARQKLQTYAKICDLKFSPSIDNPRSLTLTISREKNRQLESPHQRTVHCTCSSWGWCVVHEAQRLLWHRWQRKEEMVCLNKFGDEMGYDYLRKLLLRKVEELGHDPTDYGTHGLRSGRATEMHLEGRSIIDIKEFVGWNSLDSVFDYINPCNPDLQRHVYSSEEYFEARRIFAKELTQQQLAYIIRHVERRRDSHYFRA